MKTNVIVTALADGTVVVPNANKPEFGYVRVEQKFPSMEGGFLNIQNRSALISGKIADLKAMGFVKGQDLDGKIIAKESLTPFYEGQEAKINPSTKDVITIGGKPVYRQTIWTADASAKDELLSALTAPVASHAAATSNAGNV